MKKPTRWISLSLTLALLLGLCAPALAAQPEAANPQPEAAALDELSAQAEVPAAVAADEAPAQAEVPNTEYASQEPAATLTENAGDVIASGTCGDDLTWTITVDGVLRIAGTGDMTDYNNNNTSSYAPWYSYSDEIKSSILEKGVTSIGNYAFWGCTSLTSATIPEGVTSIGDGAFSICTALTDIAIPEGVTSIGNSAFYRCYGLAGGITVPSTVTSIGGGAFYDCVNLTGVYISDLAAWCGIDFDIYDSNPLYYVHNLYLNGELVTDLVIPEKVTSIGDRAFSGCSSLTSVTIAQGVTAIGSYAFSSCERLTDIAIPEGVTTIGGGAFWGCTGLTDVVISESVTTIGGGAFSGCANLSWLEFMGDAPSVDTVSTNSDISDQDRLIVYYQEGTAGWTFPTWRGCYPVPAESPISPMDFSTLDDENRNSQGILFTLNAGAKTATVGDNSTTPNNSGYCGNNRGTVVIPATVTKDGTSYNVIGVRQHAFSSSKLLRSIEFGAKVSSVDPTAFQDCPNFTAFAVNDQNTHYSTVDGVLYDKGINNLYSYPDGKSDTVYLHRSLRGHGI